MEHNTKYERLNPARLEFARVRRKWTKAKLAEALGVHSRLIQGYESGQYLPEQDRLALIGNLLSFPIDFFYGDDLPKISEHTASFRSMSKISGALKDSALAAGSIAFILNSWIESRFNLPEANLPDLSDLPPEEAAASLRRIWGLGEGAISNMIHLLESKGIRVYSLAIEAREIDAFSVWHNNTPFIFLNTFKSAEHSRFDAGHELGHLIRDRHSMLHGKKPHSIEMEKEANSFSSAFFMPRNSIIAHKPNYPTISQLIELKNLWGVSLSALAYRMNDIGLFTEWTYRSLCIDMAKNGYRTNEPKPMRHESSQVLAKIFAALRLENIKRTDIAADLSLKVEDLDNLTFGLTISSVPPSKKDESIRTSEKNKPNLRLVK